MILSPPRAEARFDEVDGGLTQPVGGSRPFEWGSLVPVGYAEKSMASLMQLHSELMEEKERRVDLYQRLMDKEQVLAELRMYVKLLEEKLAQTSEASRPEASMPSEPEGGAVAPQPKLRPPAPPRPPNPNRPRISVRLRPMDQRGTGNGAAEPVRAAPRKPSPPPVPRSTNPSHSPGPSLDGWRSW